MDNLIIKNQGYFLHRHPEAATSLGLRVIGCGSVRQDGYASMGEGRVLDSYALVYLVRGGGAFYGRSFGEERVQAGDVMMLFPGEAHRYGRPRGFTGEAWEEFWVIFDGATMRHWQSARLFCPEEAILRVGSVPELQRIFPRMLEIAAAESTSMDARELPSLLMRVLHIIATREPPAAPSSAQSAVQTVAQLVRTNPAREWDFHLLAREHAMSYSLLRLRFREEFEMPPYRYWLRERMRLACNYLADGISVKETCGRIGMSDPYHFSRLFKTHIGQSPRAFAREVKSWKRVP